MIVPLQRPFRPSHRGYLAHFTHMAERSDPQRACVRCLHALASSFEDASELTAGAKARAMLGVFGFEGDVSKATHVYYKIETDKRIARADTVDYVACCKSKDCGLGRGQVAKLHLYPAVSSASCRISHPVALVSRAPSNNS